MEGVKIETALLKIVQELEAEGPGVCQAPQILHKAAVRLGLQGTV